MNLCWTSPPPPIIKISQWGPWGRLQDYSLCRREVVDVENFKNIIRKGILGPGSLRGYTVELFGIRFIHYIHAPRRIVSHFLRELDQAGLAVDMPAEGRTIPDVVDDSCTSALPTFCFSSAVYRQDPLIHGSRRS